jgi:hypothetical protein
VKRVLEAAHHMGVGLRRPFLAGHDAPSQLVEEEENPDDEHLRADPSSHEQEPPGTLGRSTSRPRGAGVLKRHGPRGDAHDPGLEPDADEDTSAGCDTAGGKCRSAYPPSAARSMMPDS